MESEGKTNKQREREREGTVKKRRTMCSSCVTQREEKKLKNFFSVEMCVCVRMYVSCIVVFISFCSSAISSALFIAIVVVSGRVTAPWFWGNDFMINERS